MLLSLLLRLSLLLLIALGASAACLYTPDTNGHVVVPEGVVSIADYAFLQCTALISIVLPSSLTSLGYQAFNQCSALNSVNLTLSSSLTTIGGLAFQLCTALTSIDLPDSVTTIGLYAFSRCLESACLDVWRKFSLVQLP